MTNRVCRCPFASQIARGADGAGVILAFEPHAEPAVPLAADSAKHRGRLVQVTDDQIGAAVVVQISEPDSGPSRGVVPKTPIRLLASTNFFPP